MPRGGLRPTKGMMMAVNAAIEGNQEEVDRLVNEFKLDRKELQQRLDKRGDEKYEISGNRAGRVRRVTPRESAPELDLNITINGRTSVRKLFKVIDLAEQIKVQAQQELKRRPEKQIEPVKKVMAEIEILRKEREKLEEKIREAEEALR